MNFHENSSSGKRADPFGRTQMAEQTGAFREYENVLKTKKKTISFKHAA